MEKRQLVFSTVAFHLARILGLGKIQSRYLHVNSEEY